MKNRFWILSVLLTAFVGGCSKQEDEAPAAPPQQGQLPDDNVFSDQVKALEKAQGVQQTLDAAAAKQREDIEQQNRP